MNTQVFKSGSFSITPFELAQARALNFVVSLDAYCKQLAFIDAINCSTDSEVLLLEKVYLEQLSPVSKSFN